MVNRLYDIFIDITFLSFILSAHFNFFIITQNQNQDSDSESEWTASDCENDSLSSKDEDDSNANEDIENNVRNWEDGWLKGDARSKTEHRMKNALYEAVESME